MSITYWHGDPAPARRCKVMVADPGNPLAWSHRYTGTIRDAVEVEVPLDLERDGRVADTVDAIAAAGDAIRNKRERRGMRRIYIDDAGYRLTGEALEHLRDQAQQSINHAVSEPMRDAAKAALDELSPDVGSPGWGWRKVTDGKGASALPHAELKIDYVVEYAPPNRGAEA